MNSPLKLLLFLSATALSAQAGLEVGKPHRLIADKVRVRAEPDAQAEILRELPIGSAVVVLEESKVRHKQDGVEAPWYKVTIGKKGSGYVWGNLIAKQYAIKDGLIFLYGTGYSKRDLFTSQFRVAKAGKELARIEIDEGVDFFSHADLSLKGGRGFSGVENIVILKFRQEYCAGKGNSVILFWTGEKLLFVHSTFDGADAPVYAVETQIFPDEKGGRVDQLYIVRENGDHDDPKATHFEKFWLKWNGRELKRLNARPE